MNFAKFLRTSFLTERLRWLLLKGRSDFQTKSLETERERERERERGRERERDLKSTAADKDSITISYINVISRRDHSIDISDNIYGCLSGLSCRCFLMNFWIVSDSASSFLTALRRSCSWLFWNFRNNTLEKQCDEV